MTPLFQVLEMLWFCFPFLSLEHGHTWRPVVTESCNLAKNPELKSLLFAVGHQKNASPIQESPPGLHAWPWALLG